MMASNKSFSSRLLICYCIIGFAALEKSQFLTLSKDNKVNGSVGGRFQNNCTSTLNSFKSLKWDFSSSPHRGVTERTLSTNSVALEIDSVQPNHAGRYTCTLVKDNGEEESVDFLLFVKTKGKESPACSVSQFKCTKTKSCIFLRYWCDGRDDCGDNSDEENCENTCDGKFKCKNQRCVDMDKVCDHIDQCGDHSDEDEPCNGKNVVYHDDDGIYHKKSTTSSPNSEDNNWLRTVLYTIIACTIGVVITISFIVIMLMRVRVKRLRARRNNRNMRAMQRMYETDGTNSSSPRNQTDEVPSDQHPFLSTLSHRGNIIVNVNNGVQYMPNYDCIVGPFMSAPPPYSEVSTERSSNDVNAPPPYSTIDRRGHNSETSNSENTGLQERESTISRNSSLEDTTEQEENLSNNARNISLGTATLRGINTELLGNLLGSHADREESSSTNVRDSSANQTYVSCQTPSNRNIVIVDVENSDADVLGRNRAITDASSSTAEVHSNTLGLETPGINNTASINGSNQMNSLETGQPVDSPRNPQGETLNANTPCIVKKENNSFAPESISEPSRYFSDSTLADPSRSNISVPDVENILSNELNEEPFGNVSENSSTNNSQELNNPEQLPCQGAGASSALFNEVLRRDQRLKPKPGHLSVSRGEIILHTSEGVLTSGEQKNIKSSSPRMSGEIAIRDGAVVLESPDHNRSMKCTKLVTDNLLPCDDNDADVDTLSSNVTNSDQATTAAVGPPSELIVRNGCLVLEPSKQTASSQILSRLHGAYDNEFPEGDGHDKLEVEEPVEAVVNTKRAAGKTVSRPALPKFNTDLVLQ